MIRDRHPLLCELHAHTTWSDGSLSLPELVDVYGNAGFDVLCVTDHSVAGRTAVDNVHPGNYDDYLAAIESEAERAKDAYDLLVVPGLELTYDAERPEASAHGVAIGLREHVGLDEAIEEALTRAREAGAALIAAHPAEPGQRAGRGTTRFACEPGWATSMVDRFELVNRHDVFSWVAEARLPVVATGDFHRHQHLATWKTALPCAKDEEEVVAYLRSGRPAHLVPSAVGSLVGRASR
jgi:predicted metal-dependent phosphoesterase TrpH